MRPLRPLLLAIALASPMPAGAVETGYEARLLRLSEILGSLHFLRNLCGDQGDQWRVRMEQIIAAENADAERKARYIARFNRGYRAYAQNYAACTESAVAAIDLYMKEGESLSREIVARFAN